MKRRATEPPETSAIHEGDGYKRSGRSGIYKVEDMNDGLHLVLLILVRFDQELEGVAVSCGMQGTPKPGTVCVPGEDISGIDSALRVGRRVRV